MRQHRHYVVCNRCGWTGRRIFVQVKDWKNKEERRYGSYGKCLKCDCPMSKPWFIKEMREISALLRKDDGLEERDAN